MTDKKLDIFECKACKGDGYTIDWHYDNQLGAPIGFSRRAAARQARLADLAHPKCCQCGGRGFITKPAQLQE